MSALPLAGCAGGTSRRMLGTEERGRAAWTWPCGQGCVPAEHSAGFGLSMLRKGPGLLSTETSHHSECQCCPCLSRRPFLRAAGRQCALAPWDRPSLATPGTQAGAQPIREVSGLPDPLGAAQPAASLHGCSVWSPPDPRPRASRQDTPGDESQAAFLRSPLGPPLPLRALPPP